MVWAGLRGAVSVLRVDYYRLLSSERCFARPVGASKAHAHCGRDISRPQAQLPQSLLT